MSKSPEKIVHVYCGGLCQSASCGPEEINLIIRSTGSTQT